MFSDEPHAHSNWRPPPAVPQQPVASGSSIPQPIPIAPFRSISSDLSTQTAVTPASGSCIPRPIPIAQSQSASSDLPTAYVEQAPRRSNRNRASSPLLSALPSESLSPVLPLPVPATKSKGRANSKTVPKTRSTNKGKEKAAAT